MNVMLEGLYEYGYARIGPSARACKPSQTSFFAPCVTFLPNHRSRIVHTAIPSTLLVPIYLPIQS